MVKQQKMQSFFKRKRDEDVTEDTAAAPNATALVLYVNQWEDGDGQENQRQDEVEQENSSTEEEEEQQTNRPAIFRGVEFLERDPALRPQVWQYPQNQRDDVRKGYLRLSTRTEKAFSVQLF